MDRTGLEFHFVFVSSQNKNSSDCHLDIIHLLRLTCAMIRFVKALNGVELLLLRAAGCSEMVCSVF